MSPNEHERTTSAKEFRDLLEESPARAATLLESVHAADAALWLLDVSEEDLWQVFSAMGAETQAEVLEYAEESLQEKLIPRLSARDLTDIVTEMPPDEAVDVLASADERVMEDVLAAMPEEEAEELRELSSYPPESAGGVMTTEFVVVPRGVRLGDAIKLIKQEDDDEEDLGVFVVDDDGSPVGFLSDRDLLTHSIHNAVEDVMVEPFTIELGEDQEEAATLIAKYNLRALAVLDASGAMVGVISSEDAQEVLESEVHEDVMRLVGTSGDQQQTRLPVLTRVKQRIPLMAVTVCGGLLTAHILGSDVFGSSSGNPSAKMAILRYIPIIIGLAGNVGIQSSTILVRGFATGEVEQEREPAVFRAEVLVGFLIGTLCGLASAGVAIWMETGALWLAGASYGARHFGAALGVAIMIAVTWAAVLGCLVPMGCRRLGIDPAIVAGPFLICLSDISGSAIYVGVASYILYQMA